MQLEAIAGASMGLTGYWVGYLGARGNLAAEKLSACVLIAVPAAALAAAFW